MGELGLQLVQKAPGEQVMAVHEEINEGDNKLDQWQDYFRKQFSNLFTRVGVIRKYKVQTERFKFLLPIQQKGRRVPTTLQEKVDGEIFKLLHQGHVKNSTTVRTNSDYGKKYSFSKIST